MLKVFVDSDLDITLEEAKSYNATLISMPYIIDGKAYYPYKDGNNVDFEGFYNMLRGGVVPTTCSLSIGEYNEYFEPCFKNGDDILYIHFSSAMTCTFNAMNLALDDLKEKYPDRKFYEIDTMAITIGGYYAAIMLLEYYKKYQDIDKLMEYSKECIKHNACYFLVEDLSFFRKSGRVSGLASIVGNFVGIRPIITIGDDGKMTSIGKCKGKRSAYEKLLEYVESLNIDIDKHLVVVGNSGYREGANVLVSMLKEKYGNNLDTRIVDVNPTAGSHCGPNALGVCFYAKNR